MSTFKQEIEQEFMHALGQNGPEAICGVKLQLDGHETEDLIDGATWTYYNWEQINTMVVEPSDVWCMRTTPKPVPLFYFSITLLTIGLSLGILFGLFGKFIFFRFKKKKDEPTK